MQSNGVAPLRLPVSFPPAWSAEPLCGCVLITARTRDGQALGYATVNEKAREWASGIVPGSSRNGALPQEFAGRGWRERLYQQAIEHLQQVFADELNR